MDKTTRNYFEPRFGMDFANVRVHVGRRAADSASVINARAYTLGSNVVFGQGQYSPQTKEGKRLLAHELAHIQQTGPVVRRYPGPAKDRICRIRPGATDLVLSSGKGNVGLPEGTSVKVTKPLIRDNNLIWATILVIASVKEDLIGKRGLIQSSSLEECKDPEGGAKDTDKGPGKERERATDAGPTRSTEGPAKDRICRIRAGATKLVRASRPNKTLPAGTTVKVTKRPVTDKNRITWATILVIASVKEDLIGMRGLIQSSSLEECKEPKKELEMAPDTGPTEGEATDSSPIEEEAMDEESALSGELTDRDAETCSSLYLQKLCVYELGGFNGDRSGVETPEEMAGYNEECQKESGYTGPDVTLSEQEKLSLRSPACERGDPDRLREARISDALRRSLKYMPGGIGEELERLVTDPIFLGGLAVAVGFYLALWLVPEPFFSKIAAAATTLALLSTGVFSVSMIINLAHAWGDLEREAGNAESDMEIEEAARKFGERIGAAEADLLVFLAALLVGGKLPGPKRLPPPSAALGEAEASLAGAEAGGVVIEGPWGRARVVVQGSEPVPGSSPPVAYGGRGNLALRIETAPESPPTMPEGIPANDNALPVPANDNALPVPGSKPTPTPIVPVVPGVAPGEAPGKKKKKRPPFVLRLPRQKAPHLETYRSWLGVLQSDPKYVRGNPNQLDKWHKALRIGGSHAIPAGVYERGHRVGLTGESGERRIRVPDWTRTQSIPMEVDHIIELQVTPNSMRSVFNSMDNYELLDTLSNGTSGSLIQSNIRAERQKQVAFDPSAKDRVLYFEEVTLEGGMPGERWSVAEIRSGEQLDEYEKRHEK